MWIYLDTMLWNDLCDEDPNCEELVAALKQQDKHLVISFHLIYELARTFQGKSPEATSRARRLFAFLKRMLEQGILCANFPGDILISETENALQSSNGVVIFVSKDNYAALEREVSRLSGDDLGPKASDFIDKRRREADQMRNDILNHMVNRPKLRNALAALRPERLHSWIAKEIQNKSSIAKELAALHLSMAFPNEDNKRLRIVLKRLLSSAKYRTTHALLRADLFSNWKGAQATTLKRDLPDDMHHMVNAAYCHVYATKEKRQVDYAHLIIGKTRIELLEPDSSVTDWLLALE